MKKWFIPVVAASLALAACSPPHEQSSDVKTETATGVDAPRVTSAPVSTTAVAADSETQTSTAASSTAVAADELPGYTNCVGTPQQRPNEISLACGDNNDVLKNIKWSEWTATSATGVAERVTNNCIPNCVDGKFETTKDVKVVLSNPYTTLDGPSFTQVAVNGQVILP